LFFIIDVKLTSMIKIKSWN